MRYSVANKDGGDSGVDESTGGGNSGGTGGGNSGIDDGTGGRSGTVLRVVVVVTRW